MNFAPFVFAAALALSACAATPAPPVAAGPQPAERIAGAWAFSFDAGPGTARAVYAAPGKTALVSITCTAPRGPLMIADYRQPPLAKHLDRVSFAIGGLNAAAQANLVQAPDQSSGIALSIPVADKVFNALTPNARVAIVPGAAAARDLPEGAASRINDVLNACRASGS